MLSGTSTKENLLIMRIAAILIPAYKPDERLYDLCAALRQSFLVTVVNDGSGTDYNMLFDKIGLLGVTVLSHGENRGKGAALKTGIRYLMEQGRASFIITADADGQHTLQDITRMAQCMDAHPDTLVLGGRNFSAMPSRSRIGNTITRFFFRRCTGLEISDTQTGLRGLPSILFQELLDLPGERYDYEMNMLLGLKKWAVPYMEIPIETIYLDGNAASHFHALRDGWHVFSRVIKYTLSSLSCAAADYILYLVFLLALPVGWSYAAARVCSATLNYFLNCKLVFRGRASMKSLLGYCLLASCSMVIGSTTVGALASIGFGRILAKLMIDSCLFLANYFIQKQIIFPSIKRAPHA